MRDGIADVHHLGLSALEVQFIKVNPLTRAILDEEVGKLPRELLQQLVVEVGAPGKDPVRPLVPELTSPLKRRSSVTQLTWSLAKDHADLALSRALAKALDVDLTLHAPYYVDFFGSQESRDRSLRQILWSGILAGGLGARMVVTHLGFYGSGPREDSVGDLTEIAREVTGWLQDYTGGEVHLGIEPSGHPDVFGSREEVLEIAHQVRDVVPILNLPHLAARERIKFDTPAVLRPVIDQFVEASRGNLYLNFSGVEFYGPGEFRLTPIKRGQIKFDPIAEVLGEREYDVTVISSSPLLEHDAMYMKLLYERALTRRWVKRHQAATKKPVAPAPKPAPVPSRPAHARPPPPAGSRSRPGGGRAASPRRSDRAHPPHGARPHG
ncbi:MAG: TIM barrel protein [Thermoplasmata archaeon]